MAKFNIMSICGTDTIMFILFWILWTFEVVLTLTTHSLTLRLSMCHSMVIGIMLGGHLWANNRIEMERFLSLWFVLCYVGMVALCIVNTIHALQMLTDRHDSGVHYASLLLAVSALDFVAKLVALTFVDASFSNNSLNPICCVSFFITASLAVFIIGILRFICSHRPCSDELILWLDPALTVLAASLTAICAVQPLRDNALVLILAVPKHIDMEILQKKFENKFPHCDSQDLRIYMQSRNEVNVSVRVRHKVEKPEEREKFVSTSNQIKEFFASQGATGRIYVQPEFYT